MSFGPKTVEEAMKHRYGSWGGNPKGQAYDANYCMETTIGNERGAISHQCYKKIWKDGYCKQHHPSTVKAKNDVKNQKWEAKKASLDKEVNDKKNIAIVNKFFDYANPISIRNDINNVDGSPEVTWIAEISGLSSTGRTPYEAMTKVLEMIPLLPIAEE